MWADSNQSKRSRLLYSGILQDFAYTKKRGAFFQSLLKAEAY